MWVDRIPASSDASSTTAPAPSPNRTAVPRSFQSVIALSFSTPITNAFLTSPQRMYLSAIDRAYKKPEQAALTSMAPQSGRPSRACNRHAVLGNTRSGDVVPTINSPMSCGLTPAACIARCAATSAISPLVSSSRAIRRSLIPVRSRIHSSEVSSIFSRSALVTTFSGR